MNTKSTRHEGVCVPRLQSIQVVEFPIIVNCARLVGVGYGDGNQT